MINRLTAITTLLIISSLILERFILHTQFYWISLSILFISFITAVSSTTLLIKKVSQRVKFTTLDILVSILSSLITLGFLIFILTFLFLLFNGLPPED